MSMCIDICTILDEKLDNTFVFLLTWEVKRSVPMRTLNSVNKCNVIDIEIELESSDTLYCDFVDLWLMRNSRSVSVGIQWCGDSSDSNGLNIDINSFFEKKSDDILIPLLGCIMDWSSNVKNHESITWCGLSSDFVFSEWLKWRKITHRNGTIESTENSWNSHEMRNESKSEWQMVIMQSERSECHEIVIWSQNRRWTNQVKRVNKMHCEYLECCETTFKWCPRSTKSQIEVMKIIIWEWLEFSKALHGGPKDNKIFR